MANVLLIVEDDPFIVKMYTQAFTAEGFEVNTAGNGREGLVKAQEKKPDIILLDVMMPEMNGLDALAKIKQDSNLKSIPCIMLTNLSGTQDEERAKQLGALDYIVKSKYKPREIVEKIKAILGGGQAGGSPAPAAPTT